MDSSLFISPPKCRYPIEFRAIYLHKKSFFYKDIGVCEIAHIINWLRAFVHSLFIWVFFQFHTYHDIGELF